MTKGIDEGDIEGLREMLVGFEVGTAVLIEFTVGAGVSGFFLEDEADLLLLLVVESCFVLLEESILFLFIDFGLLADLLLLLL